MKKKIVTFGEIMMRLEPPGFERFVQTNSFNINFAGAEASVAVSLAQFGIDAHFVTKLPAHEIGQACKFSVQKYGVKTQDIIMTDDRLGVFFTEQGASQRGSKVIYDRKDSAIAKAQKGEFDWAKIFKDTQIFYLTGITPAISQSAAEVCLEAVKAAKELGVDIACDVNYRQKLWTYEDAAIVMSEIMQYVDIAIANEEHIEKIFGIKISKKNQSIHEVDIEAYHNMCKNFAEKFNFQKVAVTLRSGRSATQNSFSALLYDTKVNHIYKSRKYDIEIVDRIGSGDAFAAGLLYGLLSNMDSQTNLEFAVAAACINHTIPGDFNLASIEEIKNIMYGDGSGRVQR